jgi:hypothetical protein
LKSEENSRLNEFWIGIEVEKMVRSKSRNYHKQDYERTNTILEAKNEPE